MIMKKTLYIGASMLAAAAAVPASAADMYRPEPGGYKDGPAYVLANSWTGFYVGVHLGGAWGNTKVTDVDLFNSPDGSRTPQTFSLGTDGVFGGVQLGYNWQHGHIVLGIEGDLGGMGLSGKTVEPNSLGEDKSHGTASLDGGLYGDVTARLGYLITPSTLAYAKGGFAFLNGDAKFVQSSFNASSKATLTGWTVGGGIEHQLSGSWSVKAEYLHFDFGSQTASGDLPEPSPFPARTIRFRFDPTVETVKAGLNYHIGNSYEPLK
jgi:outer membrane immunogenic protein